jgi:hypothetical protein
VERAVLVAAPLDEDVVVAERADDGDAGRLEPAERGRPVGAKRGRALRVVVVAEGDERVRGRSRLEAPYRLAELALARAADAEVADRMQCHRLLPAAPRGAQ